MTFHNVEQGSEEWRKIRLGKVTASRVADVVARTKTGWGASRANYAAELVAERLTGTCAEKYVNAAMEWGSAQEADARDTYAMLRNVEPVTVGFVIHPKMELSGCSPDGLVGDDGLLEIKCPNTSQHIATLLSGEIDGKYLKQIAWQMACTGRAWTDFVSYDCRLPPEMQLHVRRVKRDDALIAELEKEVATFLGEVATTVERLRDLYLPKQEAAE